MQNIFVPLKTVHLAVVGFGVVVVLTPVEAGSPRFTSCALIVANAASPLPSLSPRTFKAAESLARILVSTSLDPARRLLSLTDRISTLSGLMPAAKAIAALYVSCTAENAAGVIGMATTVMRKKVVSFGSIGKVIEGSDTGVDGGDVATGGGGSIGKIIDGCDTGVDGGDVGGGGGIAGGGDVKGGGGPVVVQLLDDIDPFGDLGVSLGQSVHTDAPLPLKYLPA